MVDKVRPLKIEEGTSGTELDMLPTETDPSEDYLAAAGLSFAQDDNFLLEKIGGILKCKIADFSYNVIYSGDDVTAVEGYTSFSQTTNNRRFRNDITFVGDNPTNESIKIYDPADGTTVLRTINIDHTYSGDDLTKTEITDP